MTNTVYTATAYAACAANANNMVGTLDGYGIEEISPTSGGLSDTNTDDSDATSCCSSCWANPDCAVSIFFGPNPPGYQCYNAVSSTSGTCAPSTYSFEALYSTDFPPDTGYIISNGPCGQYNEAGEV